MVGEKEEEEEGKGRDIWRKGRTNMTSSTLSIVKPACMFFIAAPAFFIASSVSLLMFAVSIE